MTCTMPKPKAETARLCENVKTQNPFQTAAQRPGTSSFFLLDNLPESMRHYFGRTIEPSRSASTPEMARQRFLGTESERRAHGSVCVCVFFDGTMFCVGLKGSHGKTHHFCGYLTKEDTHIFPSNKC